MRSVSKRRSGQLVVVLKLNGKDTSNRLSQIEGYPVYVGFDSATSILYSVNTFSLPDHGVVV